MLEVRGLTVYAQFAHSLDVIVKDVSFCVESGKKLAILGPSGVGKSMIVNAITGTLADNCFADGRITLDGVDLTNKKNLKSYLGRKIVYLPQGGAESLNPSLKIKTQIYEAFDVGSLKMNRNEKKAYAIFNLAKVKLGDEILEKYPFEISGGEAQRVMLAIALCSSPDVIIADEPTRGLDDESKQVFLDCIDNNFSQSAVIFVTHDNQVAMRCDDTIFIKDGVQVATCDGVDDECERRKSND